MMLAAGEGNSPPAQRALETLFGAYRSPICVDVRRKAYGPDEAQDLTQGFFTQLIAQELVRQADRSEGRFRSCLLGTLS
jgi:RNA polymerase sigma-70 factor (ECF subfamily)